MTQITFKITNITCAACVKLSTMVLKKIAGVANVAVDEASGVTKLATEREIAWNEIVQALESVDKTAVPLN